MADICQKLIKKSYTNCYNLHKTISQITCITYFDPESKQLQHEFNSEHSGEYHVEIVQRSLIVMRLLVVLQR